MKLFLGIDPGLQGAVAVLREDGKLVDILNTPTFAVKKGRKQKNFYNTSEMVRMLELVPTITKNRDLHAVIENVHAMPKQGVTSMFSMGTGFGMWQGIIAALHIPVTFVEPRAWKKAMGIPSGADKNHACIIAMRLFPKANLLRTARSTTPHDGRADALLIAEHLRRISVHPKTGK